jgi:hypothetical protein
MKAILKAITRPVCLLVVFLVILFFGLPKEEDRP